MRLNLNVVAYGISIIISIISTQISFGVLYNTHIDRRSDGSFAGNSVSIAFFQSVTWGVGLMTMSGAFHAAPTSTIDLETPLE